jgi:hypothetical protein
VLSPYRATVADEGCKGDETSEVPQSLSRAECRLLLLLLGVLGRCCRAAPFADRQLDSMQLKLLKPVVLVRTNQKARIGTSGKLRGQAFMLALAYV